MQLFKCSSIAVLATATLLASFGHAQLNYTSVSPRDDTETLASINQLTSIFCFALDVKNFTALADVFTQDAQLMNGSDNAAATTVGLPAIQDYYRTALGDASIQTQHTSHTVFGYDFDTNSASSISNADAVYFGPAALERGGILVPDTSIHFIERYDRDYVRGVDGAFKISRQSLSILVGRVISSLCRLLLMRLSVGRPSWATCRSFSRLILSGLSCRGDRRDRFIAKESPACSILVSKVFVQIPLAISVNKIGMFSCRMAADTVPNTLQL